MSGENQKTILLVEDEAIIAMTEKKILEKFGYKVITAHTGEDAVTLVKKTPAIDLILMDIKLGAGMDGTEAAEIILRAHDIPIVFLSSHTEPEIVARTEKITSYGFVVKNSSDTVFQALLKMAFKLFESKNKEKEKAETLRESLERLEFANHATFNAIWDWDLRTDKLRWNENFQILFGYRAEEIEPGIESWTKRIHPEDLDRVKTSIHAAIDSGKQFWSDHYRFRCKDGSFAGVDDRGYISRDERGQPVRMIGAMQDVTAHKRAEDALRESAEKYRILIENSHDIIYTLSTDGIFTFVSPSWTTLLGHPLDQVVGKPFQQFVHADDLAGCMALLQKVIETGQRQDGVDAYRVRHADGSWRWHVTNAVPLRDAAGTIIGGEGIARDITERKRAEEVIKNSIWFQQLLMDAVPSPIFYKDTECVYIGGNKAFERYVGLSREQFIGKTVYDISPLDLAENYDKADRELLKNQGVQSYEASVVYADGTRHDVVFNKALFTDAEGKVAGLIGVILDITERKQAERLAEALLGISQAIYSPIKLDELFQRIHILISGIVPANNFFISLLSDDGKVLGFPYYRDEKDSSDSEIIKADDSQSLTVEVLVSNKSLLLDEAELQERYATGRNKVWGTAPKCWLGVPLMIGETVIGVMAVQDYHKCGAYGQKDVALLESAAGQIAVAISRKRMEKALRESVEAFKGYFNMGTVGMCVTSQEKGWIEVNDCLCRMLGYSREELLRLTWAEMTHPDDLNADLNLFNQVLAGQRDSYELDKRFIRKDGQVIHTLLYVTCQRNPDGTVHHILASLIDISERKQAEEEIQRQLAEKEILLKEVHHRIKNNIASISGLLSLRLQSVANPEAAVVLQDAIGRVNSMRILYDKLLLSEDYKDISVKSYVDDLIDTIVVIFPDSAKITLDKRIADFHLDSKQLFPLGLIINELVTNKMKYAFINRKTGLIKISLENVNNHATLTIQDNGNGLPDGFDINESKGFGLMLVKMLSQQLGGSFAMDKRAGTRCQVEFNI